MNSATITFSPAPTDIDSIIAALCDPSKSLLAVAEAFGTTTHALGLWLASADIAARIEHFEKACARRLRLFTASLLPEIALSLKRMLDDYKAEETIRPAPASDESSLAKAAARFRASRQAALAAARMLISLASFGVERPAKDRFSNKAPGTTVVPANGSTLPQPPSRC